MNEISVNRTPELIASEINHIKQETRKMVLYNSIEIGRRLTEAKSMLPHGEWGTWLEKSVDYKQSTANNLMKIFEEYGADQINLLGESNSQTFGNLSYSQAIALLGIPSDEREEFVKENDVGNMSTRELQKTIKERDEALKNLEDMKKLVEEKCQEAIRINNEKGKEILNAEADAIKAKRELQENQEGIKRLQEIIKKEKEKSNEKIKVIEEKLEKTKHELKNAQSDGNHEEVQKLQELINEMQGDLDSSAQRIDELEKQLKEEPIEATTTEVIEKIPDEVKKELEELREKNQNNKPTAKFQVYFEVLVNNFNDLIEALEEISDATVREKYKNAVHGLIDKMEQRL